MLVSMYPWARYTQKSLKYIYSTCFKGSRERTLGGIILLIGDPVEASLPFSRPFPLPFPFPFPKIYNIVNQKSTNLQTSPSSRAGIPRFGFLVTDSIIKDQTSALETAIWPSWEHFINKDLHVGW